jgi:predicted porin
VNFGNPSEGAVGGQVLFAERWLDTSFEGSWGRINVGQGSGGADDASTIDLSGTALANGNCVCDWAGGVSFRRAAATSAAGPTVAQSFEQNDFESRYDRLLYTTPTFNGFRAQVSYGQKSDSGEAVEYSLWWSGKAAGDLQLAIGYSEEKLSTANNIPNNETMGGSISWLHTSGFNVTLAYTTMDIAVGPTGGVARDADEATWIKVGYKWGPHAIAVDYLMKENGSRNGEEGTSYGIGYVWNPIRWLEVYAQYRIFQLEQQVSPGVTTTAVSFEDVTVASIGSRIRF